MKMGDISERGMDSAFSIGEIQFDHTEEGFVVGENVARSLVPIIGEIVPVTDVDYSFFEGYFSKNGTPGFAIFGKDTRFASLSGGRSFLVKVEYCYNTDLAEHTHHSTGAVAVKQPNPTTLVYRVEVPTASPISGSLISPRRYHVFNRLLSQLEAIGASKVGMGQEFYSQFEGPFDTSSQLQEELMMELRKQDEFGDGRGRYLSVVEMNEDGPRFMHGHVRGISPEGLMITDKHQLGAYREEVVRGFERLLEYPLQLDPNDIVAIYGKGVSQLYSAQKQRASAV